MTPPRSFRSQLLWGSILAAAGLIPLGHIFTVSLVHRYPAMELRTAVHGLLLSFIALGFLAAGLLLLRRGLSPFDQLRAQLGALREGRERRIEGAYPAEVQPLVDDLNALLEHREQLVERAMAKAGDLAHGLKTPLAVLSREAALTSAGGASDLAGTVSQQVERMRRQVDYHLAHARAVAIGAAPGARCGVGDSVEGLVRALLRLHAGRGLSIEANVHPEHTVRGRREDLDEMLGNLLDNACQWARSRVTVESSQDGETIVVTIDDDGPGLSASMREMVLKRGVRADEAAPGSGLGLAIVRDLAELHGGSISLDSSSWGGVRARLRLPASEPRRD
jgi:signal transduction histidine kinase